MSAGSRFFQPHTRIKTFYFLSGRRPFFSVIVFINNVVKSLMIGMMQPQQVIEPPSQDIGSSLKLSHLHWTVEQTRSSVCAAPFAVDMSKKIDVRTKYGDVDKYIVDPNHFAKVHCWVSFVDPRNKGIRCDGINIHGVPTNKDKNYKMISIEDWKRTEDRVKEMANTCHAVLIGIEK
jgi:hypothetical protein